MNMKRMTSVAVGVAAIAVVAYLLWPSKPTEIPAPSETRAADRFGDEAPASPDAQATGGAQAQPGGQPLAGGGGGGGGGGGAGAQPEAHASSGPVTPPSLGAIREEVRGNPHQTPASLLNFAENIANRIEEAEGSPEKARTLFDELESCVLDNAQGAVRSIQALCLTNAEDLAGSHPELKDRYDALSRRAPAEVQKLLDSAALLEQ